eukprot:356891-Chlamydomonas_euryale.AAC.4
MPCAAAAIANSNAFAVGTAANANANNNASTANAATAAAPASAPAPAAATAIIAAVLAVASASSSAFAAAGFRAVPRSLSRRGGEAAEHANRHTLRKEVRPVPRIEAHRGGHTSTLLLVNGSKCGMALGCCHGGHASMQRSKVWACLGRGGRH